MAFNKWGALASVVFLFTKRGSLIGMSLWALSDVDVAAATSTVKTPEQQYAIAIDYLFRNISPSDALPGTVIASPSRQDPDYYFHWVRDAALVMNTVLQLYLDADTQPLRRQQHLATLHDFVQLTRRQQATPTLSGLGEPKFYVDGRGYDHPWGRPQNDGPALRALTFIRLADQLLKEGKEDYVRRELYHTMGPPALRPVIKVDLEHVSHEWRLPDYDLWEEVKGAHFYTRYAQRSALREGARLARKLGDPGAAEWYEKQATLIEEAIGRHLDHGRGIIVSNIDRVSGLDYKKSGLDTSVALAVLHSWRKDGYFPPSSDWILGTLFKIEKEFQAIYTINSKFPDLGTAYGRYPEDVYFGGNPWFLTTFAVAELFYHLISELEQAQRLSITERSVDFYNSCLSGATVRAGDVITPSDRRFAAIRNGLWSRAERLVARGLKHVDQNGSMAEQINRETGFMLSARDLTWSYASFVTLMLARKSVAADQDQRAR